MNISNLLVDSNFSQSVLKELAGLRLKISNYAFSSEIIWYRIALNKFETWNKAEHRHSFYEMHLCLTGYAAFEVGKNNVIEINAGDFAIFSPKTNHKLIKVSDDFTKVVLGFNIELMDSEEYSFLQDALNQIKLTKYKATEKMLTIPFDSLEEIKQHRKGYKFAICELLTQLIIEFARVINPVKKEDFLRYSGKDTRLDSLILYMRDNLHRRLTAEDFANEENMSAKQLNRIMMENFNMSVSAFFKKEKINKAKELLETTDMTISQLSTALGFSDEFSFSKTFKRIEGITPANYRASYFLK